MVKKCKVCGCDFEPAKAQTQICSDECRKEMNRIHAERHRNKERVSKDTWKKLSPEQRLKKRTQIEIKKNSRRAQAREWIDKYNSSGMHGGNAMLAKEAGMQYEAWMRMPIIMRSRKREEILNAKRRDSE